MKSFKGCVPLAGTSIKLNVVWNGGKRAEVKVWIVARIYFISSAKDTINEDQGDYANYTVRSV